MKRITKGILLAMMLILAVSLLASCGNGDGYGDGPIRIGAITSLSGALQDYGEQF
ncbi:MAG: hypothetical protein LBE55_05210 [Clostridiales bacterium]|nr:hypothetical protein [Clostridiales bacterium]